MLGLKQEELIAIGDNQIDESMILYAGLGVAIGNALDEIKDVSDYISPDNDHEGVAHVIEKIHARPGAQKFLEDPKRRGHAA